MKPKRATIEVEPTRHDLPCDVCLDTPIVATVLIPGRPTTHLCLAHARELRLGTSRALRPRLRYGKGPPVLSIQEFTDTLDICRSFWDDNLKRCVASGYVKARPFSYICSMIQNGTLYYRTLVMPHALPAPQTTPKTRK